MEKKEEQREAKKKWLWRYRNAMFMAQSLWRQAEEWQSLICEPSCKVLDGMPKTPGFSNNGEKEIVRHLELIDEAKTATQLAKELRKEIISAIEEVENKLSVQILILRYVEGRDWKEIRNTIKYSKTHTTNLHHNALDSLKIVPKCSK